MPVYEGIPGVDDDVPEPALPPNRALPPWAIEDRNTWNRTVASQQRGVGRYAGDSQFVQPRQFSPQIRGRTMGSREQPPPVSQPDRRLLDRALTEGIPQMTGVAIGAADQGLADMQWRARYGYTRAELEARGGLGQRTATKGGASYVIGPEQAARNIRNGGKGPLDALAAAQRGIGRVAGAIGDIPVSPFQTGPGVAGRGGSGEQRGVAETYSNTAGRDFPGAQRAEDIAARGVGALANIPGPQDYALRAFGLPDTTGIRRRAAEEVTRAFFPTTYGEVALDVATLGPGALRAGVRGAVRALTPAAERAAIRRVEAQVAKDAALEAEFASARASGKAVELVEVSPGKFQVVDDAIRPTPSNAVPRTRAVVPVQRPTPEFAPPAFKRIPVRETPQEVGHIKSSYSPTPESIWKADESTRAAFQVGRHTVEVDYGAPDPDLGRKKPYLAVSFHREHAMGWTYGRKTPEANVSDLVQVGYFLEDLAKHNTDVPISAYAYDERLKKAYLRMGFDLADPNQSPMDRSLVLNPEKLAKTMERVRRLDEADALPSGFGRPADAQGELSEADELDAFFDYMEAFEAAGGKKIGSRDLEAAGKKIGIGPQTREIDKLNQARDVMPEITKVNDWRSLRVIDANADLPEEVATRIAGRAYIKEMSLVINEVHDAMERIASRLLQGMAFTDQATGVYERGRFGGVTLGTGHLGVNHKSFFNLMQRTAAKDRAGFEEFSQLLTYISPYHTLLEIDQRLAAKKIDPVLTSTERAWAGQITATIIHEIAHNLDAGTEGAHAGTHNGAMTRLIGATLDEALAFRNQVEPILKKALASEEFWDDYEEWQGYKAAADQTRRDALAQGNFSPGVVGKPASELGGVAPRPGDGGGITTPPPSSIGGGGAGGGGLPTPSGVPSPTPPGVAAGPRPYPSAPTIREPDLALTPQQELGLRRSEASGMLVRKLGELGNHLDAIISGLGGERMRPLRAMREWFTSEATRLESPMSTAASDYKRATDSIEAWAKEVGKQDGQVLKSFGRDLNKTFIATDGQPVLWRDENKVWHKLTVAEAIENYDQPQFAGKLTPEQYASADQHGSFMRALQAQLRARGGRIGTIHGINGQPVTSYVHRMTTEIDADGKVLYKNEFGDPLLTRRAGAKISSQNPRDYPTRAEGAKNGVRYAGSIEESMAAHAQAMKQIEQALALKKWTDRLTQTIADRVEALVPGIRAANVASMDELKLSERLLKEATKQVQRRAIITARKDHTLAMRAVERAEGRLASETLAPKLQGSQRDRLIQQVGRARENLVSATEQLKLANEGAVNALRKKYDPADEELMAQMRARAKQAKDDRKAMRKRMIGVIKSAQADSPREKFQPGGLPIVAGRIVSMRAMGAPGVPYDGAAPGIMGDAQWLTQLEKNEVRPILGESIQNLSQPMRWFMAAVDASSLGNQGFNTFVLDAPAFFMAALRSFAMAASPGYRSRLLQAKAETLQQILTYAPGVWDANPDFDPRGNIVAALVEKGIERQGVIGATGRALRLPFRFTEAQFRSMRGLGAIISWEHFYRPDMTEDELYDLGSFVTKNVGVSRTVGPEKGGLFAASWVRSQIGLGMDAIANGGVQGQAARILFTKLLFKATIATILGGLFIEGHRDPDKLLKMLDPREDNSFQVAGVSLFGPWRPLFRLLAGTGEALVQSGQDQSEDPLRSSLWDDLIANWGRSKLNPPISKTLNSLLGEDTIGQPTSWQNEWFNPLSHMPLALQQSLQDIEQGENPYIAIAASITGLRYLPDTAKERVESKLSDLGIKPKPFFTQANYRHEQIALHPELGEAYADYEEARRNGSVKQRKAQEIIDDARGFVEGKIAEVRSGEATPVELKDFKKDVNLIKRTLRNEFFGGNAKDDHLFAPLYDAYEQSVDPATGEVDLDKATELQEAYLTEHPELREDWEKQQYVLLTDDPAEARLAAGQRAVNDTYEIKTAGEPLQLSYYGSDDFYWQKILDKYATRGQQAKLLEDKPHLRSWDAYERYIIKIAKGDPADALAQDVLVKDATELRSFGRQAILSQYPEVGANLVVWYGINLADTKLSAETLAKIRAQVAEIKKDVYGE